jgi:hypothetical protein
MSVKPALRLTLFAALFRAFGCAAILWWLGAPVWAVAAWVMANIRVGIGRPQTGGSGSAARPERL